MSTYRPLPFSGRFLWHNDDHPLVDKGEYRDHLPEDIFNRLTEFIPRENSKVTAMVRAYPTQEAALAALARAQGPVALRRETSDQETR